MRSLLLIAFASLTLSACGSKDQSGNAAGADDSLTAESIVANDVTAIDAVTGDAANMAADVDFANELANGLGNGANAVAPANTASTARPRKPATSTTTTTARPPAPVTNQAGNATD